MPTTVYYSQYDYHVPLQYHNAAVSNVYHTAIQDNFLGYIYPTFDDHNSVVSAMRIHTYT